MVIAIGVCLTIALFITRGVEIRHLRRELYEIRRAQESALVEQTDLRERLSEKDDPTAIEEQARKRLGLVKPGEEKVIFDGEESR